LTAKVLAPTSNSAPAWAPSSHSDPDGTVTIDQDGNPETDAGDGIRARSSARAARQQRRWPPLLHENWFDLDNIDLTMQAAFRRSCRSLWI